MAERNDIPELREYTADDYNRQNSKFTIKGTSYVFAKFASGGTVVEPGDAITITSAGTASVASTKKINGIAAVAVNPVSADKWALVAVEDDAGIWANVWNVATASADWSNLPLIPTASADGFYSYGRPVTGAVSVTGATNQFTSANLNEVVQNVTCKLRAVSAVSAVTGLKTTTGYYKYGTAGVAISAMTAPISAELKVGDVITTGGETQVVTAVATASSGLTGSLATAFTTAAIGSGTASACATLVVGKMRVRATMN